MQQVLWPWEYKHSFELSRYLILFGLASFWKTSGGLNPKQCLPAPPLASVGIKNLKIFYERLPYENSG